MLDDTRVIRDDFKIKKLIRDDLKKNIFSDIVTKGGRGSGLNHNFRSCQNSDKMVRWGGG